MPEFAWNKERTAQMRHDIDHSGVIISPDSPPACPICGALARGEACYNLECPGSSEPPPQPPDYPAVDLAGRVV